MKILAIESSCDETAAAIVSKNPKEEHVKILSNVVASSLVLHSKTGGVIPNIAAREQLKAIIPVIEQAIEDSKLKIEDLDAIAVTQGPGLIGSLLIGVETAKTLAYLWNKPIIPVNHLFGHIYANFIGEIKNLKLKIKNYAAKIKFPLIVLLVSGGHTDLLYMEKHGSIKWLGGTRDDAAGEAFDKIGRLLSLPYPAGPVIESIAKDANDKAFNFPRPMIGSKDFDFSFSGLKAAVWREVMKTKNMGEKTKADIAASVQKSIIDVLIRKTLKAAKKYNVKSVLLSGGVAANQKLRDEFKLKIKNEKLKIKIFAPQKSMCTDNAAMIGTYAAFHPEKVPWDKATANPELYFG
jgi:N6-L-threonylcarbamoyladenine synthase